MKKILKKLRMAYLLTFRYRFRKVGGDFYCGKNLFVRPHTVDVGDYVFIGKDCHLAVCSLTIGDFVMFAPRVAVVGGDHRFDEIGLPTRFTGRAAEKPVVVENDVWVGYGAIIMHGVTLGEGSVIAAGSVVTQSVPPYTIWGGVPARHLKNRFSSEEEQMLHRGRINNFKKQEK